MLLYDIKSIFYGDTMIHIGLKKEYCTIKGTIMKFSKCISFELSAMLQLCCIMTDSKPYSK